MSSLQSKKNRIRFIALPVTICLHLLAIYFLLTITRNPAPPPNVPDKLTVRLIPLQSNERASKKKETVEMPPVSISEIAKKRTTTESTTPSQTMPPTSTENTILPLVIPKQEAPAAIPDAIPGADRMILNAKRDIGKIDREIRNAFPQLPAPTFNTDQSKLGKAIAAAAKSRSMAMETFTLSDGRKMTKVTGPGGSYCAMADPADRNTSLQSEVRMQVTTCPN